MSKCQWCETREAEPDGWIILDYEDEDGDAEQLVFCCWDCLIASL